MKDLNIGKSGRVQLDIIDNHLIEFYYAAVEEERMRILIEIRMMIQEKDAKNDKIAVEVIDWVLDRLTGK